MKDSINIVKYVRLYIDDLDKKYNRNMTQESIHVIIVIIDHVLKEK